MWRPCARVITSRMRLVSPCRRDPMMMPSSRHSRAGRFPPDRRRMQGGRVAGWGMPLWDDEAGGARLGEAGMRRVPARGSGVPGRRRHVPRRAPERGHGRRGMDPGYVVLRCARTSFRDDETEGYAGFQAFLLSLRLDAATPRETSFRGRGPEMTPQRWSGNGRLKDTKANALVRRDGQSDRTEPGIERSPDTPDSGRACRPPVAVRNRRRTEHFYRSSDWTPRAVAATAIRRSSVQSVAPCTAATAMCSASPARRPSS